MPVPANAFLVGGAYDSLIEAVGPFEPRPAVAVGVSGGADSMALALIADGWARRRGGSAVCLTVDHGLRPDSAAEARAVSGWLKRRGIARRTLRWRGEKPATGVEAAARKARYDLLSGWCRRRGVLHLLLAHHLDDQAETVLMRLARGSGPDGLAAMSSVAELAHLRIARPLLGLSGARLKLALEAAGQDWIEDPMNRDPGFTRVRIRQAMPALAQAGLAPGAIAEASFKLGRARAEMERTTARLLARAVEVFPAGYARISGDLLRAAPPEIARRALSAVVTCIGGLDYPPRSERLARLYDALAADGTMRPRTLGGCIVAPRRNFVLVSREPAAVAGPEPLSAGAETVWDGRFRVRAAAGRAAQGLTVGALGGDGWADIAARRPALEKLGLPRAARLTAPAIRRDGRLIGVPCLPDAVFMPEGRGLSVRFSPPHALSRPMFSVV